MIGVIGVKRNVDIAIREKLALYPKKHKKYVGELLNSFKEVVILNTCIEQRFILIALKRFQRMKFLIKFLMCSIGMMI